MSKKKLKPGKYVLATGGFNHHEKYIIRKILSGETMEVEDILAVLSHRYPPNKLMSALESLMTKIEKMRTEGEVD